MFIKHLNTSRRPFGERAFIQPEALTVWLILFLATFLSNIVLADHFPTTPVLDAGGIDNVDGGGSSTSQSDITATLIGHNEFGWAWDETSLSGSNSHDVCTYFDEDGDVATTDDVLAVCYKIEYNQDGSVADGFPIFETYFCGSTYDPNQQKCTGGTPPLYTGDLTVVCGDPMTVTAYFTNDPDPDLEVLCTMEGAIAETAVLLNTCSKSGESPSSASKDCIFGEAPAFLELIKVLEDGGNALEEDFTLLAEGENGEILSGNGITPLTPVTPQFYDLSESVNNITNGADNYELISIDCGNGNILQPDGTASVLPQSGDATTCIFTNQLAIGTLTLVKIVDNLDLDETDPRFTDPSAFPLTVDGQSVNTGETITVDAGDHTIAEETLTGYSVADGGWACTDANDPNYSASGPINSPTADIPVPPGGDITCTITNVLSAAPALEITKVADPQTYSSVGQEINYTITAKNIGNVTLDNVTVTDPGVDGLSCNPANGSSLAPMAEMVCTATHIITQEDLDNGRYMNTACVDDGPDGATEDCDDETVTAEPDPKLMITKVADPQTYSSVGQEINYTITAKNIGNVTLDNVTVTDPGVDDLSCIPANGSSLAPMAEMVCTASHEITQEDLDNGRYMNTACVDDGPDGATEDCDDETVTAEPDPKLMITKVADPQTYSSVGQEINYTITAKNIGNVTLDNVTVTDPGVDDLSCIPANGSSLAPMAEMVCTASHEITQEDLDNGRYINTACVDDGPDGATEDCDDETVTAEPDPKLMITKVADPQTYSSVGQEINYTITAKNIGNVTLDNVTVTDPGVDDLSCIPANGSSLAPMAEMVCTATHIITQEDLDNGRYMNTACVDDGPDGATEDCDDETVTAEPDPKLMITKVADPQTYSSVGQEINYTITAKNIGNVTLDNVTVTDPGVDGLSCNPANGSSLAPMAEMVCTASHEITQEDLDNGRYMNTACVDDGPDGATEDCDDETVTAEPDPKLMITKVADPQTYSSVGQEINYTITAKNIGNVTLDNVTVTDPGVDGLSCNPANGSSLAPMAEMVCTASHEITQADIDAGNFANIACVDDGPDGAPEVCDNEEVPAERITSIVIEKSGSLDRGPDDSVNVGDIITYNFDVINTGNVTLINIVVTDPLPNLSPIVCDGSGDETIAILAPGATESCSATYMISQADIDNEGVSNTAFAEGEPATEDGDPIDDAEVEDGDNDGVSDDDSDGNPDDPDDNTVRIFVGKGTGTPGYWKNHTDVWKDGADNVLTFDFDEDGHPDFDLDLDGEVEICQKEGAICIELTPDEMLFLLDARNYKEGRDKRFTLYRTVVAAWLNINVNFNGCSCIQEQYDAAIALLDQWGNPLDGGEPIKGGAWGPGNILYKDIDSYNNHGAVDSDDIDVDLNGDGIIDLDELFAGDGERCAEDRDSL